MRGREKVCEHFYHSLCRSFLWLFIPSVRKMQILRLYFDVMVNHVTVLFNGKDDITEKKQRISSR